MGEVPDWYEVISAAKYLGVAPWDLMEQPVIWRDWARMASNAEAAAQRQKRASNTRKKGMG